MLKPLACVDHFLFSYHEIHKAPKAPSHFKDLLNKPLLALSYENGPSHLVSVFTTFSFLLLKVILKYTVN